jgi:alpha-galactosidase
LYSKLKTDFRKQLKQAIAEVDDGSLPEEFTGARYNPGDAPEHRKDLVRKDMCVQFGAFITESSGHLSEYLPYYRKSEEGRKLLRAGYDGGSRFYATCWPDWRKAADKSRLAMLKGEESLDWKRSWEYAAWIIEAREKNVAWRFHGNVMNNKDGAGRLITNLPDNGCVEVACLVDGNGIQPTRYGALPPQMAALCSSNLSMFDLGAQAAIERSKELAVHALMLDPLTAAVCTPSQIRDMTMELFEAEKDYLPGYK